LIELGGFVKLFHFV